MPSNEKIVIAILVIIIVLLSIYSYNTHTALVADREKAEAELVKHYKFEHAWEKVLENAAVRGEFSKETSLALKQAVNDFRVSLRQ